MKDQNKDRHFLIYTHINKINGKIYTGQSGGNPLHWAYVDTANIEDIDLEEMSEKYKDYHRGDGCPKSVICIETGKVYRTMTEAAEENHISISMISSVCKVKCKTAAGKHWRWKESK